MLRNEFEQTSESSITPAYPGGGANALLVATLRNALHFMRQPVPVTDLPEYLRRCVPLTPDEAHFADADEAPTLPAWLTRYVSRGFQLVFWPRLPDPKNDWKGPREDDWPTKDYPPSMYRDGMQVGAKLGTEIAPGRFLWDADLDWEPGIRHIARFLPNNTFAFGRASKRIGHLFLTSSAPVFYFKYQDVDKNKTCLGERRGLNADGTVGKQTVLPPSVHRESGEILTLALDGEIRTTMLRSPTSRTTWWPACSADTGRRMGR